MKPNSRLSHLIEAARRQPLPPGHDREPPPGFAAQMAARAWRDAGNGVLDESVPWLTGLSWGFAGSALIAAAVFAFLPTPVEEPNYLAPLLGALSSRDLNSLIQ